MSAPKACKHGIPFNFGCRGCEKERESDDEGQSFGCDVRELSAPCRWCGYNGPNYWQAGTHAENCPWHHVGGMAERAEVFNEPPPKQAAETGPLPLDNGTPLCAKHGHRYELHCHLCANEKAETGPRPRDLSNEPGKVCTRHQEFGVCISCGNEAAEPLVERVRQVVKRFKADEAQGYRSRDRQYAINMLEPLLSRPAPSDYIQKVRASTEVLADRAGRAEVGAARPASVQAVKCHMCLKDGVEVCYHPLESRPAASVGETPFTVTDKTLLPELHAFLNDLNRRGRQGYTVHEQLDAFIKRIDAHVSVPHEHRWQPIPSGQWPLAKFCVCGYTKQGEKVWNAAGQEVVATLPAADKERP